MPWSGAGNPAVRDPETAIGRHDLRRRCARRVRRGGLRDPKGQGISGVSAHRSVWPMSGARCRDVRGRGRWWEPSRVVGQCSEAVMHRPGGMFRPGRGFDPTVCVAGSPAHRPTLRPPMLRRGRRGTGDAAASWARGPSPGMPRRLCDVHPKPPDGGLRTTSASPSVRSGARPPMTMRSTCCCSALPCAGKGFGRACPRAPVGGGTSHLL